MNTNTSSTIEVESNLVAAVTKFTAIQSGLTEHAELSSALEEVSQNITRIITTNTARIQACIAQFRKEQAVQLAEHLIATLTMGTTATISSPAAIHTQHATPLVSELNAFRSIQNGLSSNEGLSAVLQVVEQEITGIIAQSTEYIQVSIQTFLTSYQLALATQYIAVLSRSTPMEAATTQLDTVARPVIDFDNIIATTPEDFEHEVLQALFQVLKEAYLKKPEAWVPLRTLEQKYYELKGPSHEGRSKFYGCVSVLAKNLKSQGVIMTGMSEKGSMQYTHRRLELKNEPDSPEDDIHTLSISKHIKQSLCIMNIASINALTQYTESILLGHIRFTKHTLLQLRKGLSEMGRSLKQCE